MKSLQAALDYIQNAPPRQSLSPVRQVSPGSIVVHTPTNAVYLCCMVGLGRRWGLYGVTSGKLHGRMFDGSKDDRSGLPIDGFVDNPGDYLIFYGGKLSNSLETCAALKR